MLSTMLATRWARRALLSAVVISALALTAGPAHACSILPPPMPPALSPLPNEPPEAYQARLTQHLDGFNAVQKLRAQEKTLERQKAAWSGAETVAVIEIVSRETGVEIPVGRGVRTRVKPVAWIKGADKRNDKTRSAPFTLAHTAYTSCGPSPNWPVFNGAPGDRYVIFLSPGAPVQERVLDVLRPSEIVLGDVTAALAAQLRMGR